MDHDRLFKELLSTFFLDFLTKRLGSLSPERLAAIERLDVEQLESLAEAVFEITSDADLAPWLG